MVSLRLCLQFVGKRVRADVMRDGRIVTESGVVHEIHIDGSIRVTFTKGGSTDNVKIEDIRDRVGCR